MPLTLLCLLLSFFKNLEGVVQSEPIYQPGFSIPDHTNISVEDILKNFPTQGSLEERKTSLCKKMRGLDLDTDLCRLYEELELG